MRRIMLAVAAAVLLSGLIAAPAAAAAATENNDEEVQRLLAEAYDEAEALLAAVEPELAELALQRGIGPSEVIAAIADYFFNSAADGASTADREAYEAINETLQLGFTFIGLIGCIPPLPSTGVGAVTCAASVGSLGTTTFAQQSLLRAADGQALIDRQLARTVLAVGKFLNEASTGPQCIYATNFIYCCQYSYYGGYYCTQQNVPIPA